MNPKRRNNMSKPAAYIAMVGVIMLFVGFIMFIPAGLGVTKLFGLDTWLIAIILIIGGLTLVIPTYVGAILVFIGILGLFIFVGLFKDSPTLLLIIIGLIIIGVVLKAIGDWFYD